MEKVDVLVREDVSSMVTYQMMVLDLVADSVNARRMMMIHFFSESVRTICGISRERVPESELVTMVQEPIYRAGKDLSKPDKGDRPRKSNVSRICSSAIASERKSGNRKRNSVTINSEVTVHLIPYEDRRSEWMQRAIDRCHFQRRIQLFEELYSAL